MTSASDPVKRGHPCDSADHWATAAGTHHYPLKPSKQGRNYWRYSGGRGWRIPQPSSWALLPIAQCSSAASGDELSAVLESQAYTGDHWRAESSCKAAVSRVTCVYARASGV